VRAETRHRLKEDRFSTATIHAAEVTAHWSVEHRSTLIYSTIVAVVLAASIGGTWYYFNQQDLKASASLSQAVRTLNEPIRPANMPPQPEEPSFASSKERATEAHKQFQAVVTNYPHTRSAEFARYFVGITSVDLGDNAAAEKDLSAVASYHNGDLSALARFALASIYRNTNRNNDAINIYKDLVAKPTSTVGKTAAEMELASTYRDANQPLEAKRLYEQIQKDNPNSDAARMAGAKLAELK
jgi:predicted negative regulator of RcsB-dependent stress response